MYKLEAELFAERCEGRNLHTSKRLKEDEDPRCKGKHEA